ncbi:MAG: electron transport complex subunit RsxE [Elusimicrobia bacterium]|nr:electron transport complex subunit RsxE [Elusimicrobiota bacterium]MBU2615239.1 electron transport complex subunit RsxE [Elusimicrobiota bacterium]
MLQNSNLNAFLSRIWRANPVVVLMVGLCPVLAITTTAYNSIGLGAAVSFVLICSGLTISLIRKFVPNEIKIPASMVIIAFYTTFVDYFIQAYFIELSAYLGIFIPLIMANCLLLNSSEIFYSVKNSTTHSFLDAAGFSIGFSIVILLIGSLREILGSGAFMGQQLFQEPVNVMVLPAGGFLLIGILLGILNWFRSRFSEKNDK